MIRSLIKATPVALLAFAAMPASAALTPAETKMAAIVDAEYERTVGLLERLVNQNSGSMNLDGVEIVGRMMRA
jgi:glutamate carboxypeptidase